MTCRHFHSAGSFSFSRGSAGDESATFTRTHATRSGEVCARQTHHTSGMTRKENNRNKIASTRRRLLLQRNGRDTNRPSFGESMQEALQPERCSFVKTNIPLRIRCYDAMQILKKFTRLETNFVPLPRSLWHSDENSCSHTHSFRLDKLRVATGGEMCRKKASSSRNCSVK